MSAYEDELKILEQDLDNHIINIEEYNKRLKDIESEL